LGTGWKPVSPSFSKVAFDVPGERIVQRKQPPGTSAATSETKTVARNGDPPSNSGWEGGHSWPPLFPPMEGAVSSPPQGFQALR
jgi:hypothetical protein